MTENERYRAEINSIMKSVAPKTIIKAKKPKKEAEKPAKKAKKEEK